MKKLLPTIALATSFAVGDCKAVPTAIFHGFGDECNFPGMSDFASLIGEKTGSYAACVEIGSGSLTSIFENFEK